MCDYGGLLVGNDGTFRQKPGGGRPVKPRDCGTKVDWLHGFDGNNFRITSGNPRFFKCRDESA